MAPLLQPNIWLLENIRLPLFNHAEDGATMAWPPSRLQFTLDELRRLGEAGRSPPLPSQHWEE
jgi:hypothetical protein